MKLTKAQLQTKVVDLEKEPFEVPLPKSKQVEGQPVKMTPLTVRLAMVEAITTSTQEDRQQPDEGQIIERYHLAHQIMTADNIELTSDQVTLIKNRMFKHWASPELIGFVLNIIDPASLKRK
jgi:hypothetical protein